MGRAPFKDINLEWMTFQEIFQDSLIMQDTEKAHTFTGCSVSVGSSVNYSISVHFYGYHTSMIITDV